MNDSSPKQTFWFSRIRFSIHSILSELSETENFLSSLLPIKFYYIFNLATSWLSELFSVFILIESCPTFMLACYMISIKFDIGGCAWGFQLRRCAITRNVSSACKGWRKFPGNFHVISEFLYPSDLATWYTGYSSSSVRILEVCTNFCQNCSDFDNCS